MLKMPPLLVTAVFGVLIAATVFFGGLLLEVAPPILYVVPIGLAVLWVAVRIARTWRRAGSGSAGTR
jgi:hypothetical protein